MPEYTPYQKKIIERYYDRRRDEIALNRLQEIVGELYLAETEAKRKQLWGRAEKAMTALQVPSGLMKHIMGARKVEVLAHNVRDWLRQATGQSRK